MKNITIVSILIIGLLFNAAAQQKMNMAGTAKHPVAMHHRTKSKKTKKMAKHHHLMAGTKMGNATTPDNCKMTMHGRHMRSGARGRMKMGNMRGGKKMMMPMKKEHAGSMKNMQMGDAAKSSEGKKMDMPMKDNPMKGMKMHDTSMKGMKMDGMKMMMPMKKMRPGSMKGMKMTDTSHSGKAPMMMPMQKGQAGSMQNMQMSDTAKSSAGKKMDMPMKDNPMDGMKMQDTSMKGMKTVSYTH